MSDLKAQEFYQLYRKKTLEAGFSPIGRQRFTGIIKTLSLMPETFDYIQNKANGVSDNHEQALPINSVSNRRELLSNFASWYNSYYDFDFTVDDSDIDEFLKIAL